MNNSWHIRKGDRVVVICGKDKGKTGEISLVLRKIDKVIVKGINIITKHQKPSTASAGGVVKKEHPIHRSNVMIADPKDGRPTRVGMKILEDGSKARFSKKSGENLN